MNGWIPGLVFVGAGVWSFAKSKAATPAQTTVPSILNTTSEVGGVTLEQIQSAKSMLELDNYYKMFASAFLEGQISRDQYSQLYQAFLLRWKYFTGG